MDITQSIAPNSEQVNADDLISSPRTVRITDVKAGNAEQPVWIFTDGFPGRSYRPSKSMRRVLVACWGGDASAYIGRSLTLYRNPETTFGPQKVGGIEISHMSNLDKPVTLALTIKRGKKAPFTVQPLPDATPAPSIDAHLAAINAADSIDGLKQAWQDAASAGLDKHPQILAATNARKAELSEGAEQ